MNKCHFCQYNSTDWDKNQIFANCDLFRLPNGLEHTFIRDHKVWNSKFKLFYAICSSKVELLDFNSSTFLFELKCCNGNGNTVSDNPKKKLFIRNCKQEESAKILCFRATITKQNNKWVCLCVCKCVLFASASTKTPKLLRFTCLCKLFLNLWIFNSINQSLLQIKLSWYGFSYEIHVRTKTKSEQPKFSAIKLNARGEKKDLFILKNWRDRELFVCCVCIDDSPLFDRFTLCVWWGLCFDVYITWNLILAHTHTHKHTLVRSFVRICTNPMNVPF